MPSSSSETPYCQTDFGPALCPEFPLIALFRFAGPLLRKVVYQDEYPTYDFTEEDENLVMNNSGLVKFTDWSYEEEFRLVSAEPNYEGALPVKSNIWTFPVEMLKGVICGYKISGPDQAIIKTWCKNYPRDLFIKKATLHDEKFYLRIIDA